MWVEFGFDLGQCNQKLGSRQDVNVHRALTESSQVVHDTSSSVWSIIPEIRIALTQRSAW